MSRKPKWVGSLKEHAFIIISLVLLIAMACVFIFDTWLTVLVSGEAEVQAKLAIVGVLGSFASALGLFWTAVELRKSRSAFEIAQHDVVNAKVTDGLWCTECARNSVAIEEWAASVIHIRNVRRAVDAMAEVAGADTRGKWQTHSKALLAFEASAIQSQRFTQRTQFSDHKWIAAIGGVEQSFRDAKRSFANRFEVPS